MDLGLNQLTDDQLLELVQQACQELAVRDPYVRNIAQATITTAAERLELQRQALKKAVETVGRAYVAEIQAETIAAIREGVKNGTVRLLTPALEARVAVEADLEARIALIDEMAAEIQCGKLRATADWQGVIRSSAQQIGYDARSFGAYPRRAAEEEPDIQWARQAPINPPIAPSKAPPINPPRTPYSPPNKPFKKKSGFNLFRP